MVPCPHPQYLTYTPHPLVPAAALPPDVGAIRARDKRSDIVTYCCPTTLTRARVRAGCARRGTPGFDPREHEYFGTVGYLKSEVNVSFIMLGMEATATVHVTTGRAAERLPPAPLSPPRPPSPPSPPDPPPAPYAPYPPPLAPCFDGENNVELEPCGLLPEQEQEEVEAEKWSETQGQRWEQNWEASIQQEHPEARIPQEVLDKVHDKELRQAVADKDAWDANAEVGKWLEESAKNEPNAPPDAPAFPNAPPLPPYTTPPDLLSNYVAFAPPVRCHALVVY